MAKIPIPVFHPRATTIPVLRYLVAVAEHGHFGRAAAACAVSQPTLSAQIAQWEKRMKVQVFERSGAGAHPTAIGARIVGEARALLQGLERLEQAVVSLKPPFYGAVRLGVIPTVGPYLLPLFAPLIEMSYPTLDMPIREAQTGALLELLDASKIDVVLLADVPGLAQGRTVTRLYDEPFFVAVPKGHALALKERIGAGDLANERVLLLDEGHCLRDQALDVCGLRDADDRLGADWRATSLETLRQMVALRHGCTVLPALSIDRPVLEGVGHRRPTACRQPRVTIDGDGVARQGPARGGLPPARGPGQEVPAARPGAGARLIPGSAAGISRSRMSQAPMFFWMRASRAAWSVVNEPSAARLSRVSMATSPLAMRAAQRSCLGILPSLTMAA